MIRNHIFIALAISILILVAELFTNIKGLVATSFGLIMIIGSLFLNKRIFAKTIRYTGIFLLLLGLFTAHSIWLVLLVFLVFIMIFKDTSDNLFYNLNEVNVLPIHRGPTYYDVVIHEPYPTSKSLYSNQSITEIYQSQTNEFSWDDINMVYFGGDQIVDFASAIIPNRETTVVIRKVYGRIRIILPKELGLKINFASLSGRVVFESEEYTAMAENIKWISPEYQDTPRKINLIVTTLFGNVEVIYI